MNTNKPTSGLMSLDEALTHQNTSGIPVKTFVGYNLGPRTFTLLLSLFELQQYTEVANEQSKSTDRVAQRKLDIPHATALAKYILKGLLKSVEYSRRMKGSDTDAVSQIMGIMGTQPYLAIPPLVASYRDCGANGTNLAVLPLKSDGGETAAYKIFMNHGDVLWIVDGQHRRKGVELVFEFLNQVKTYHKYPSRASLAPFSHKEEILAEHLSVWMDCLEMTKRCTVAVEVHLGLDIHQERQLFHDLNNLAKKVERSLAFNFDGSNPINQYIKEVLIEDKLADANIPVYEKDQAQWINPGLTRKELVAINAVLFLNKTNINGAMPGDIEQKSEYANAFWDFVTTIPHMTDEDSKLNTVAAQPVVLKAIAKIFFDFFLGRNKEWNSEENQRKIKDGLSSFDFSHNNPAWRYYDMKDDERNASGLSGLKDFLPSEEDGANRDIGVYDESAKTFRFGAKHNDIFPLIGDILRWQLSLPTRKK